MRGLQKSKRVSWASDLNLCQVKLFLSDESPSQVGLGGQDHLQAKASWPWHSGGAASDDNLPPGFEGIQPANLLQNKLSQVPLIQWKCPSRFVLDPNWQVAAGEESKELEFESQREMRVLEAVYPRPSAIPPNPASPMGTENPYYNHQNTPLIPITPIEDEDMPPDSLSSSSSSIAATNTSFPAPATMGSQSSGVEPDVVSAAYSALNAAMSNGSQGGLIDPNLLIKILSNPTLIEKLVSSTQGTSTSGSQISQPPPISVAEPPPPPPPPRTTHLPFSTASSSSSSSNNTHYPPPSRAGAVPVTNLPPPPPPPEVNPAKKDINYYKSLIQQHGGEKAEAVNNNNNNNNVKTTRGDNTKGKIMKPCIYYNSTRGCRHGANCVFQHDSSSSSLSSSSSSLSQQQQQQKRVSSGGLPDSKRMKMDSREISGT